jgi:hypothetical protein
MLFFSNQMGKTHSKPLASRHGRGTAWARHAMCESALTGTVRTSSFYLACDRRLGVGGGGGGG